VPNFDSTIAHGMAEQSYVSGQGLCPRHWGTATSRSLLHHCELSDPGFYHSFGFGKLAQPEHSVLRNTYAGCCLGSLARLVRSQGIKMIATRGNTCNNDNSRSSMLLPLFLSSLLPSFLDRSVGGLSQPDVWVYWDGVSLRFWDFGCRRCH